MALFDIPNRPNKSTELKLAKKTKSVSKTTSTIKGGGSLMDRIATIKAMVEKYLGKYKDEYIVIQDEQVLADYIDKCIDNCVISIDTETTGLDPLLDDIVGICIYTTNEKPAYIPISHISYITQMVVPDQLGRDIIQQQFERIIEANIDVIMFNANFDIRVLRNNVGLKDIYCTWDCYLAARLLNENEESSALKKLHQKYVLDGKEDAFKFDEYFKGICFNLIPIQTAYLYAAHDAIITYELYEYQKQYLSLESDRQDLRDIAWVFFNIEMPCVKVICDMEDNGIKFDFDYNQALQDKYHALLDDRVNQFNTICDMYSKEIEAYRKKTGVNCKLENPINIKSSTQLSILLYDIMGCKVPVDKKTKKEVRTTNEETLKSLDNPIAKAILDYREFSTIVDTFIDKLPNCVNPKDGRIHCSFNQYGAKTGRMSSENPNMQNLPSHAKDIRPMFIASNDVIEVETIDNCFIVEKWCEVKTDCGWKYASSICVGDRLCINDNNDSLYVIVSDIKVMSDGFKFYY
jgi:DNA polymerase I-like protein with 3'-5' exonuclease and polymerase domains